MTDPGYHRPPLLQMYFYVGPQNCFIFGLIFFLGCRQQQKTWLPVWKQTARPCCCLPAGATLASRIPVGTRIIRGDHSFLSEHKCLLHLASGLHLQSNFLILKHMKYQIFCRFHPNAERFNATSAPWYPPVTLKEEGQRSLHQTPETKQWELGVDSPRRNHLPRREWSPFVSYCGMWRQIDEGRVIPLGPGEAAGRAASPE